MGAPLFAANFPAQFLPPNSTKIQTVTTAGRFSSRVPCGIGIPADSNILIMSPVFAAQTDVWAHYMVYHGNSSNSATVEFQAYNSGGTSVVRLRSTYPSWLILEWWNGTAWVTLGSVVVDHPTLKQFDIHIKVAGAASVIEWFIDQAPAVIATGDFSSITNIAQISLDGANDTANPDTVFSEIIVHTEVTIMKKAYWSLPTANGANTGFTGSYTAVDEPVLDNTDYLQTTSAGVISTFTAPARALAEELVDAVVVSAVALKSQSSPQNIKLALRKGGTNYASSAYALTFGFGGVTNIFGIDPSTAAAWTIADAAAATLEFGVQSSA